MKKNWWGGLLLILVAVAGFAYASSAGIELFPSFFKQLKPSTSVSNSSPFPSPIPSPVPVEPVPIKILFGGDLMFDRHIRERIAEHGIDFVLADLQPTFAEYDAVIANLEGPISDYPSKSVGSAVGSTNNFLFTFDPAIAPMLKRSNFQVVNLGNNHIQNFGVDGVDQTKKYLAANQIKFFGDTGTEESSAERVLVYPIKDLKLGFVNYNEFIVDGYEHALADIAFIKDQVDMLIVYTHWGAEYQPIANQTIQNQAHEFVRAGADLVIGSHPHVTQQVEDYQGKRIYYSLGNFVFDQYFSPETRAGLLVGLQIDSPTDLTFTEIPIQLNNTGQTVMVK